MEGSMAWWRSTRTLLVSGVVVLGLLLGLGPRVRTADAKRFNPLLPFGTSDVTGSGMVGVVPGQTFRLNVVNIIGVTPPDPCAVRLRILDTTGGTLVDSGSLTLQPGTASFVDFTPTPATNLGRIQVRVLVELVAETGEKPTPCVVLPSFEVFDNATLKTDVSGMTDPTW
jgi:hypothetical protein